MAEHQASSYVSGRAAVGDVVDTLVRAAKDADDLRLLLHTLDVQTIEAVVAIIARYFPDELLSERSRQLVEDLLAEQHP